ncbi:MAG TPA: hypothetical protein VHE11_11660, partial [Steroidobacteraceae bacterium]|nr:hypothetical protein [Steroidobacteraceae bacterium]
QAARAVALAPARVVVAGYEEPSLVFLLGSHTRFASGGAAAAAIATRTAAVAIVSARDTAEFLAAARDRHVVPRRVADVRGIDPVHGRRVELGVWVSSRWSAARAVRPASSARRHE